jgi:hypothetical protein
MLAHGGAIVNVASTAALHIRVPSEAHLRRVLRAWVAHFTHARSTRRSTRPSRRDERLRDNQMRAEGVWSPSRSWAASTTTIAGSHDRTMALPGTDQRGGRHRPIAPATHLCGIGRLSPDPGDAHSAGSHIS